MTQNTAKQNYPGPWFSRLVRHSASCIKLASFLRFSFNHHKTSVTYLVLVSIELLNKFLLFHLQVVKFTFHLWVQLKTHTKDDRQTSTQRALLMPDCLWLTVAGRRSETRDSLHNTDTGRQSFKHLLTMHIAHCTSLQHTEASRVTMIMN